MADNNKQRWSFLIALTRQLKEAYDEQSEEYEAFSEVLDRVVAECIADNPPDVASIDDEGGDEGELPFDGPAPRSGAARIERHESADSARPSGRGMVRVHAMAGTLHTRHRRR